MTVERTMCKYVIQIGTGVFCGHPNASGEFPCDRDKCEYYTPLMYQRPGFAQNP